MAVMTKKQRVRAAIAGEPVDRAPVSMWGHDFLREWSAEDLVAATLEPYRAHDWDFIKLNPRWTFFAEAWGNTYDPPSEQRNPRTTTLSLQAVDDLRAIAPVDATAGVFDEQLRGLRSLIEQTGGEVDVVQTLFSPLSVVGLLGGLPDLLVNLAAEDAAAVHTAIAAVTETLIGYARATLDAGASGVFFAPLTWASRDTCSEDFYREFGRPYDLLLLDQIRDAEFNILHVCRDHNMLELLLDYPVAAFNWADQGTGNPSLAEIHARTGRAVMGGIDQTTLADVGAVEVASAASAAGSIGDTRLFVTPGCSIPPATPDANRAALAAAVRT
jgi:uroporphyrinogen decarboxylase